METLSDARVRKVHLPPLSLRSNLLWMTVGNFVAAACQFGVPVVLARLGDAEAFGRYAFGLAVVAPIIIFARLHLRTVQVTEDGRRFRFGDYLRLTLLMTAGALLVVAALAAWSGYARETAVVVALTGVMWSCESVSETLYGLFQRQERMDKIAISLVLRSALSLVCVGVAFWWARDVAWGVVAMAGAWAAVLLGYDVPNARRQLGGSGSAAAVIDDRAEGPWRRLAALALLTLPLGLTTMLLALNANIPRYFIEHYRGLAELGVFAVMMSLTAPGTLAAATLGQTVIPRMARYYAEGRLTALSSLLARLFAFSIGLGVASLGVAYFFGERLLTVIYSPEFAAHADVLVWLFAALGPMAGNVFLGNAVNAMRRYNIQLPVHILSNVLHVPVCMYFIANFGLKGAAWSVLISALCVMAIYGFFVVRGMRAAARAASEGERHEPGQ